VKKAETWEGLSEAEICERIVARKPGFKVITGLLPKTMGLTRAIMAAAIEAGALSNKDLVIATPTLEDLGLLKVQEIRDRWEAALRAAEDQRAGNIARNVKSKETKEALQVADDAAVQKAVAEVLRLMRVYVLVDISGSMENAIETAKRYIGKFLQAFPKDQVHVGVFNTVGREIKLKAASQLAVEQAFVGIKAGGGTSYGEGVRGLSMYKPREDEDTLLIFVGDEDSTEFSQYVQASGLRPMAFGLLRVFSPQYSNGRCVRDTARVLGIPCFMLDEQTFEDPYAVPQKLRALIAATPVGAATAARPVPRVTLIDQILATPLLKRPCWAA
jgi:hypothetical protein